MSVADDTATRPADGGAGADPGATASTASTAPAANRNRVDLSAVKVVPTRHWFRWVFGAVVLFVVAQLIWTLFTNDKYDWGTFGQYFFSETVVNGLVLTLQLTVGATVIGFGLGILLAAGRLSKSWILSSASWAYIWFFRSVPLVVQLVVWYNLGYLFPQIGLGTPFTYDFWIVRVDTVTLISQMAAAFLGLGLHQAAYSAEIIRGGLLSVDSGQLEAAGALGLPRRVRFFRIVLPQAARSIVPNAANEVISLVKGASVVFVIALPELFYAVQVIYNRNSRVIPLLIVAVVWYTIVVTLLSIGQYYLERHYAKGSVRVLPPTPLQRARHWARIQWARLGDGDPTAIPELTRSTDRRAR
ncbi:amino acid ABC transporter permease [Schumannella luteola]|uniref:Polar amino acid transport system permease protein n=1 Tax=Schumannella luteola TaxID=472059 RepID=A0A852YJM6_9MICO|nr:amino acid ABC transporter permease [Schumannella luteola]NYG99348.1 polar amino acid transport system permease protein [Schumannella luteola]TPX06078.1 amino acid ABC transporter permease [Schumannella luteola]